MNTDDKQALAVLLLSEKQKILTDYYYSVVRPLEMEYERLYTATSKLRQENKRLQKENDSLEKENSRIRELAQKLRNDKNALLVRVGKGG